MAATIGIKIANGEFYSIIDEDSNVKKRLVLTTVHDKQRSVQIDLYRSYTKTMADALYIGSLVVEDIREKTRGEPSIEMIIACDADGHISAEALDLDTGSGGHHQYLNVSLKSLDENNRDIELPDFELEQQESPPQGLYERASAIKKNDEGKRGKRLWPLVILFGVLIIAGCLALFFFLIHGRDLLGKGKSTSDGPDVQNAQPVPPVESAPAPVESTAPPAAPAVQPAESTAQPAVPAQPAAPPPSPPPVVEAPKPPVIQAPAQPRPAVRTSRTRNPPVASYKVPTVIPRNGVAYKIRWGDTLWDIAEAFYRNPWLYPRIARYNGIRNPDLIISGTTIRIPPKN
jgi:LysM repeat protein